MAGNRVLCVAGLSVACGAAAMAREVFVEGEGFARCEETLFSVYIGACEAASGGRLAAVSGRETGRPTWFEYDVEVEAGLYELRLRAGGNDSRQAGLVSLDGGPAALVLDDPPDSLPAGGAAPADSRERSRRLEATFREHLVAAVRLAAGRHRIRIQHGGVEGRSNAFGVDWVKLTPVAESTAPRLEAGDRPEPDSGRRGEAPRDVEVELLVPYRFWGPGETPRLHVLLRNRERAAAGGTLLVEAPGLGRLFEGAVGPLPRGGLRVVPVTLPREAPRGDYACRATLVSDDGARWASDPAPITLSELDTPAWARRARTRWLAGFGLGSDLEASIANARQAARDGISVGVNANVLDMLGNEAISYPFRGRDEDWYRYLEAVHEAGLSLLMYHTMVTVSEHFYYEHKDFWGGRKPFYHCSWLSIFPDSPEWNRFQAADLEYFFRKYPLDGIFLDNACATGGPGIRTAPGEDTIARHQSGLRAAIRRANPTGILYPNYNTLTPQGLSAVARAWDAHMLEGVHPVPQQHRGASGWAVSEFVTVLSRVRGITGKPFWPLMYAPERYGALCIAACAAARANPCGVTEDRYLHFLRDVQEYLYADEAAPMPAGSVKITPEDPDLAATLLVRCAPGRPPEWVVQIVNGTEADGRLAERDIELDVDLPETELSRPAWLLRPESAAAQAVRLSRPLSLRVGVWTMLVIAERLTPKVRVSPPCIRPVPGETTLVEAALESWTPDAPAAQVQVLLPEGWPAAPAVEAAPGGKAQVAIRAPREAAAGNVEAWLAVRWGEHDFRTPLLLRVRPRLSVTLRPDHFGVLNRDDAAAALRLRNHSSEAFRGTVRLQAPEGWAVEPREAQVSVPPGEETAVGLRLSWPSFRPVSLYDLRDGDLMVRVEGSETVETAIPVRLHVPVTWLMYCPLGTRPKDSVRTGATPEGGLLSDIVFTVNAVPGHYDDAAAALRDALRRQASGEYRVVLWFRTGGGKGSDQLGDPELQRGLAEFLALGGGIIFQETVFRDSVPNRSLLAGDLCPVGAPYEPADTPGGDWVMVEPQHPAVEKFSRLALEGRAPWGIPPASQPPSVAVTVKPWARVIARDQAGNPALVVSDDPARPVAYLAGALEGAYIADRQGTNDYPGQMPHLLYFYPELARWLSLFGGRR